MQLQDTSLHTELSVVEPTITAAETNLRSPGLEA